jgi:ubiquinone/menaquinone biosynthesis C-methylase UbiE
MKQLGTFVQPPTTVADVVDSKMDDDDVRRAYDTVASDYSEVNRWALTTKPFDRAMLVAFAELINTRSLGRVADLGCGPGHVTAFLQEQGLDVFGVDLSSQMIRLAKKDHPTMPFQVGSIHALALGSGTLGGITSWYSIIHTPPGRLPETFDEFSRVLVEGGYLVLAFQVGNEQVHIERGYGHSVKLDAYRMDPNETTELLSSAGFSVQACLVRQPDGAEKVSQACLLAKKA